MSLRELAGEIKCFYYELMSVEDNGFRVMQCFTIQQHLPQCVPQQCSLKEAAGNIMEYLWKTFTRVHLAARQKEWTAWEGFLQSACETGASLVAAGQCYMTLEEVAHHVCKKYGATLKRTLTRKTTKTNPQCSNWETVHNASEGNIWLLWYQRPHESANWIP